MKDIFVGNLDYDASEDDLRQLFAAYGPVDRVRIVTDRYSGQPRGFAFVEMASVGDAQKAITELNGAQLHGRKLDVRPLGVAQMGLSSKYPLENETGVQWPPFSEPKRKSRFKRVRFIPHR